VALIHNNITSDHKTNTAGGARIGICSMMIPPVYSGIGFVDDTTRSACVPLERFCGQP
jgi:hypothetical protein